MPPSPRNRGNSQVIYPFLAVPNQQSQPMGSARRIRPPRGYQHSRVWPCTHYGPHPHSLPSPRRPVLMQPRQPPASEEGPYPTGSTILALFWDPISAFDDHPHSLLRLPTGARISPHPPNLRCGWHCSLLPAAHCGMVVSVCDSPGSVCPKRVQPFHLLLLHCKAEEIFCHVLPTALC